MSAIRQSAPGLDVVARAVASRTGLSVQPSRRAHIEDGIRRAMARAGLIDPAQYLCALESAPALFDELVAELVVGETYFFRDRSQFDFIRSDVLPEIARLRGPSHVFRAWSAGCSSGEEPYSLAILLEECGQAEAYLLATDISEAALAKAREAVYGRWSLRNAPAGLAERYFRRSEGRMALDERFRRRVRFNRLNLAMDPYPSLASGVWGLDLILCRNVLIYLDAETIELVAERLFRALALGGWLITGPSDPPLHPHAAFEAIVSPAGVFYRRPVPGMRASRPPLRDELPPPTALPDEPALETPPGDPAAEPAGAPEGPPSFAARDDIVAEADAALAQGRYAAALESTRARLLDSPSAAALHLRALANLEGPAAAARVSTEIVRHHPLSAELHFLRAVLLAGSGRGLEAVEAARKAIYLDRTLAMAHIVLASALRQQGDAAGACRAYRNALALIEGASTDDVVPLSDGESASRLSGALRAQLVSLGADS